jgi:glycosyltransferase involved in cell wall biosynthesis
MRDGTGDAATARAGPPEALLEGPIACDVSSLLVERPHGVAVVGGGLLAALAAGRPAGGLWQVYRLSRFRRRRLLPDPGLPSRPFLGRGLLLGKFRLVHALDTRLPSRFRGPLVVTLHDVISALPIAGRLRLSSPRFQERKRRDYREIARRADLVITLSRETRDRFLDLGRPRGPVRVIPPGIDPEFLRAGASPGDGAERRRALGADGDYLLAVGGLHRRKNFEGILRAFREARSADPGLHLLVAGAGGDTAPGRGEPAEGRVPTNGGCGEGVRFLGYVARSDLAALYAGARALLYLSHYEGYGVPVLEAMAAGSPVIASDRGGIPEAAGDAALLVDPDRPETVDRALESLRTDAGLRAALRSRGILRARRFTWEAAAAAAEEAYLEAADVRRTLVLP